MHQRITEGLLSLLDNCVLADRSGRGTQKFGDDCVVDRECGFADSYCEPKKKKCACKKEFEATNSIDKCGHRKLTLSYVKYFA